jgi:hypothetical protein
MYIVEVQVKGLIEIEGVQWLETATCERGFSLRTQILTAQCHPMGDSLRAFLMMICSNGPSLHEKEVEEFLLAVVARFKELKWQPSVRRFVRDY